MSVGSELELLFRILVFVKAKKIKNGFNERRNPKVSGEMCH